MQRPPLPPCKKPSSPPPTAAKLRSFLHVARDAVGPPVESSSPRTPPCSAFSTPPKPYTLADGGQFTCTAVYAPTEHSEKQGFLEEISLLAPADSHPWIIFDDFNLVRFPDDKNNEAFHATEAAWFNSTVHGFALLEIPLVGRQFTWSNRRDNPTLVRLDRDTESL